MSIIDSLKQHYKSGNIAIKIIFWNVGIFLVSVLFYAFFKVAFYESLEWIQLNGNFDVFIEKPWTILTYAFLHDLSPDHIIINMLMLFIFSRFFFRFFRTKDFITFYVFGALSGGLAFLIYTNVFHVNTSVVGASAAVYAIIFAVVAYSPKMQIQLAFINIKFPLDYLAYGIVILDLVMIAINNNRGGSVAHLGGALFGFFYMKQFETGNDFLGKSIAWIKAPKFNFKRPKTKFKTQKNKTKAVPRDDYDYQDFKSNNQEKIDKILDKISAAGYESLTKSEKEFLFKQSKK